MHTPEQAKELWCPMVRLTACTPDGLISNGQTVFNRLQNDRITAMPDSSRCIANHCAMWRWLDEMPKRREYALQPMVLTQEPERPKSVPQTWIFVPHDPAEGTPAGWIEPEQECMSRRRGYCGLAGSPAK